MKNNEKYLELREKYNTFIYHSYKLSQDSQKITIEYNFEIVDLATFNPKLVIYKKNLKNVNKDLEVDDIDLEDGILKNLAFNFGMEDIINYLKLTCSKNVVIECGYLDEKQEQWFRKLYINGLGEFFYINGIDFKPDDFVTFTSNKNYICKKNLSNKKLHGNLIPVGGGKDSCVTLEVLKPLKNENTAFVVETNFNIKAPNNVIEVAGYKDNSLYAKRILDTKMFELNKQGFLNGHTPFSAMLAFLTNIVAYVAGKKYVVLSNESSANEPTVKGTKINHQYSKSIELENDFRWYENNYLKSGVEYFSLLRPLTELQIAKIFTSSRTFNKVFRSCNVGSKDDVWCCNCPKCLFVYIMLSTFLTDDNLISIFGENLLEKENLKDIFYELIGKEKAKPFECVGTIDEINFSICKKIQRNIEDGIDLPKLLKIYFEKEMKSDISKVKLYIKENEKKLLHSYFDCNNVKGEFKKLLKKKLKED
ncbi:MAG: hypothetical protein RSB67_03055 [Clostridia bacterium]